MLEKLADIETRYNELLELMSKPHITSNPELLMKYGQEQANLQPIVETLQRYRKVSDHLADTKEMLQDDLDDELRTMAKEEYESLEGEMSELEQELHTMLLPKDPNDDKNVIMEIRAGAGGDEAGLFAADLFRLYSLYADGQGWKTTVLSKNESGIGGFKEIIFEVRGNQAYSKLKYESGVHRVQRVG